MSPVSEAVKAAEKAYRRFSWNDRQQLVDEVHRLTDAGVSAGTIADLVGLSERSVVRIRAEKRVEVADRLDFTANRRRELDMERLADAAIGLGCRLRDEDPQLIWEALDLLDRRHLQELAVVCLAAMPVDRTKSEMFAWLGEW